MIKIKEGFMCWRARKSQTLVFFFFFGFLLFFSQRERADGRQRGEGREERRDGGRE
jgi:hypothetical protein